MKFLGFVMDARLNWRDHIKFHFVLKTVASSVSKHTALKAYHAYAHSNIKYGIMFWGALTNVNRIFILQKGCVFDEFLAWSTRRTAKDCFMNMEYLRLLDLTSMSAFIS